MKIYEIRDISSDEAYFSKKYCLTAQEAVWELKSRGKEISDAPEDTGCVIGAIFEHEIGAWEHEDGFDKKIFEMRFTQEYEENSDEYEWKSEITLNKLKD